MSASAASSEAEAAAVDEYLAQFGCPATLADFSSAMAFIKSAGEDWAAEVSAAVREAQHQAQKTGIYMADYVTLSSTNGTRRGMRLSGYLPAAQADPLRASDALAALIAAFEAAGA